MRLTAFVEKAYILLQEAIKDVSMECYNKAVSTFWFSIEQLLRAIVYFYKRITYERSGKLISAFSSLPYGKDTEVLTAINTLYNLRILADHTTKIINRERFLRAMRLTHTALEYLLPILEKIGVDTKDLRKCLTELSLQ